MLFKSLQSYWNPTFSAVENDSPGTNPMMSNKSALKDFLMSIASMTGDLSNITAPPFVLDTKSVTEIPAFWGENPRMFAEAARSEDPAERALLVLKNYLAGMKSQCYMGHSEEEGVKKPLNAFLGEIFTGSWEDEELGETYMVSEQVSHHPPITACRVWNPKAGVIAQGFNRQKVTFSMSSLSVHIASTGFAIKTLEKYDEHYLLPLPNFKVKGVLSGAPYPETSGDWYIPSTNGYTSRIQFSGGKGLLGGGKKHGFTAVVYKDEDGPSHPIYTVEGAWNSEFTIKNEKTGDVIETYNVDAHNQSLPKLQLPALEEMDPWESRRAWHDTAEGIRALDYRAVTAAKGHLEQGQRNMRKDEEKNGTKWQQLFFKNADHDPVAEKLVSQIAGENYTQILEGTKGLWKFDQEAWETKQRPYRPGLEPDNLPEGEERIYKNGKRGSISSSRNGTPRSSIDVRRGSVDTRRSMDMPRQSIDEKVGAKDLGKKGSVDGVKMDVGREPEKKHIEGITCDQPMQQTEQLRNKERDLGSGVEGLTLKEKIGVEDMLRDMHASTPPKKR